ncbi:hypothetical protein D3C75_809400 [compost metagenome]
MEIPVQNFPGGMIGQRDLRIGGIGEVDHALRFSRIRRLLALVVLEHGIAGRVPDARPHGRILAVNVDAFGIGFPLLKIIAAAVHTKQV